MRSTTPGPATIAPSDRDRRAGHGSPLIGWIRLSPWATPQPVSGETMTEAERLPGVHAGVVHQDVEGRPASRGDRATTRRPTKTRPEMIASSGPEIGCPSGKDYPQAAQVAYVRNAQVKRGDTCKRGTSDLHLFWIIFDGGTAYLTVHRCGRQNSVALHIRTGRMGRRPTLTGDPP